MKKQIDFFMHDAEGRILMTGNCPECELPLQQLEGASRRVGQARVGLDYFDGASVRAMPARPSPHHAFDYRMKQWRLDTTEAWAAVRRERDTRLAASDWTTLPDVPLTNEQRAAWYLFRQALRDVTQQPDPLNIEWPAQP